MFSFWEKFKTYLKKLKYKTKGFPILPGLVIFCFIFVAIFGETLAPHSATDISLTNRLLPPFFQSNGSITFPIGTDMLGRDMLSRIIIGARPSLIVALTVIILGGLGGTAIGIISGYKGGMVDVVIMRVADGTIAFPIIMAAMLLSVVFGPSMQNVIISISVIIWSRYARVVRGEVLSIREMDYIAQAKVAGASGIRIMIRHILPNIAHTIIIMLTLQIGSIIIVEASLSFLGAGIPAPIPVWGSLIAKGREYIVMAWWIPFFPGFVLTLVCLSFNMLGDWLREVLDPRMTQV